MSMPQRLPASAWLTSGKDFRIYKSRDDRNFGQFDWERAQGTVGFQELRLLFRPGGALELTLHREPGHDPELLAARLKELALFIVKNPRAVGMMAHRSCRVAWKRQLPAQPAPASDGAGGRGER